MSGETPEEQSVDEFEIDEYVLADDAGNTVHFGVLLEFEYDGVTYRAMSPVDQIEDEDNDAPDVYLFVYEAFEEDGEPVESFSPIPDEATFDKVSEYASQQLEVWAGA